MIQWRSVLSVSLLLVARAAQAETPVAIPLELTGQQRIDHATHHVQGLAVSAESYWISSVDRR